MFSFSEFRQDLPLQQLQSGFLGPKWNCLLYSDQVHELQVAKMEPQGRSWINFWAINQIFWLGNWKMRLLCLSWDLLGTNKCAIFLYYLLSFNTESPSNICEGCQPALFGHSKGPWGAHICHCNIWTLFWGDLHQGYVSIQTSSNLVAELFVFFIFFTFCHLFLQ